MDMNNTEKLTLYMNIGAILCSIISEIITFRGDINILFWIFNIINISIILICMISIYSKFNAVHFDIDEISQLLFNSIFLIPITLLLIGIVSIYIIFVIIHTIIYGDESDVPTDNWDID